MHRRDLNAKRLCFLFLHLPGAGLQKRDRRRQIRLPGLPSQALLTHPPCTAEDLFGCSRLEKWMAAVAMPFLLGYQHRRQWKVSIKRIGHRHRDQHWEGMTGNQRPYRKPSGYRHFSLNRNSERIHRCLQRGGFNPLF
jgi:hypothetical protein